MKQGLNCANGKVVEVEQELKSTSFSVTKILKIRNLETTLILYHLSGYFNEDHHYTNFEYVVSLMHSVTVTSAGLLIWTSPSCLGLFFFPYS